MKRIYLKILVQAKSEKLKLQWLILKRLLVANWIKNKFLSLKNDRTIFYFFGLHLSM